MVYMIMIIIMIIKDVRLLGRRLP